MSEAASHCMTLNEWIAREAIGFDLDAPALLDEAIDRMMAALGGAPELLGFGEALHGGEEILVLRNRLFARLVAAHGFSAIAVESSFPRGRVMNEYIAGRGPAEYESVAQDGFSHGFGQLAANRELIEWMRRYNADPHNNTKLQFYGFDSPTEMTVTDTPRRLLEFALDYLVALEPDAGAAWRQRIEPLLGADTAWENPAVAFDPSQGIGLSDTATKLRIEVDDLIAALHIRRPALVARSDAARFAEAARYGEHARQLLAYHASLARASDNRIAELLGMRDAMMADNLAFIAAHTRGRVLVFAHNSHLKRGQAAWQLGPQLLCWWTAGAQLQEMFGPRYAVIGTAVGMSGDNGIASAEAGTLEARLTTSSHAARFIPTHRGQTVATEEIAALPTRSGSLKNPTYFPLTAHSLADFDGLIAMRTITYNRGGPTLPEPQVSGK